MMHTKYTQREKATRFHELHKEGNFVLMPNIWDVLGAKLLEDSDYPAIATASASIAFTNGYPDGECIPFTDVVPILTRIANSVNIPVTADIESGYSDNDSKFQENIKTLITTGIVGINIEDTNHTKRSIFSIDDQCKRIKLIRAIADDLELPLFINARTDVLLYDEIFPTDELQYKELLQRGIAYKEAGANCFFPIALRNKDVIQKLVTQLKLPINILAIAGIPDFKTLKEIGVTRVSLGPSFLKIAIKAMKTLSIELKYLDGLSTITENEITTDYLKTLINKS
ncbi:MAG: isocitrate lyase/phosphoenolpyruvate mutase family protein [Bacteroidetes bacterium]|nr:isocitrate lyase/phosphoenolpyruvate mutase family protein [Bacteroidota bacterium]